MTTLGFLEDVVEIVVTTVVDLYYIYNRDESTEYLHYRIKQTLSPPHSLLPCYPPSQRQQVIDIVTVEHQDY